MSNCRLVNTGEGSDLLLHYNAAPFLQSKTSLTLKMGGSKLLRNVCNYKLIQWHIQT